jgi:hypothetical protein
MIAGTTLAPRCWLVAPSIPRPSATGQLDADRNETQGADLSSPTDVNIRNGAAMAGRRHMKPSETAMF